MSKVVVETPDCFKRWQQAPQKWKDGIQRQWGRYIGFLVDYIKREKLSGQVLGKYEGWQQNESGGFFRGALPQRAKYKWSDKQQDFVITRSKSYVGTLKKNFGAQIHRDLSASFMETIYGRAWEHGFSRKEYPVAPLAGNKALAFYHPGVGRVVFSRGHRIPAQTFPAKPHIRPSIHENLEELHMMVIKPVIEFFARGGR